MITDTKKKRFDISTLLQSNPTKPINDKSHIHRIKWTILNLGPLTGYIENNGAGQIFRRQLGKILFFSLKGKRRSSSLWRGLIILAIAS